MAALLPPSPLGPLWLSALLAALLSTLWSLRRGPCIVPIYFGSATQLFGVHALASLIVAFVFQWFLEGEPNIAHASYCCLPDVEFDVDARCSVEFSFLADTVSTSNSRTAQTSNWAAQPNMLTARFCSLSGRVAQHKQSSYCTHRHPSYQGAVLEVYFSFKRISVHFISHTPNLCLWSSRHPDARIVEQVRNAFRKYSEMVLPACGKSATLSVATRLRYRRAQREWMWGSN